MNKPIIRPASFERHVQFVKHTLARQWEQIIKFRISREYSQTAYEWCRENINGRWSHDDGKVVFYFEQESDAVYFKLRWVGGSQNEGALLCL